jgi:hypothetical protein
MKKLLIITVIFVSLIGWGYVTHNNLMNNEISATEKDIQKEEVLLNELEEDYDSMAYIKFRSFSMPNNKPGDLCCVELDSLLRRMDKMEYRLRSTRQNIEVLTTIKERYQERVL